MATSLNINCENQYFTDFLTPKESAELYQLILEDYQFATLQMPSFMTTADGFKKLMFLDSPLFEQRFFKEEAWGPLAECPELLNKIKEKVEEVSQRKFQVVVAIYYPNGNSGVGYHSDFSAFGDTSVIASISLGEERIFQLREKSTGIEHDIKLENGSLFIMGNHCQERYEHQLPIDPSVENPRINLTFRQFGYSD